MYKRQALKAEEEAVAAAAQRRAYYDEYVGDLASKREAEEEARQRREEEERAAAAAAALKAEEEAVAAAAQRRAYYDEYVGDLASKREAEEKVWTHHHHVSSVSVAGPHWVSSNSSGLRQISFLRPAHVGNEADLGSGGVVGSFWIPLGWSFLAAQHRSDSLGYTTRSMHFSGTSSILSLIHI